MSKVTPFPYSCQLTCPSGVHKHLISSYQDQVPYTFLNSRLFFLYVRLEDLHELDSVILTPELQLIGFEELKSEAYENLRIIKAKTKAFYDKRSF